MCSSQKVKGIAKKTDPIVYNGERVAIKNTKKFDLVRKAKKRSDAKNDKRRASWDSYYDAQNPSLLDGKSDSQNLISQQISAEEKRRKRAGINSAAESNTILGG